MATANSTTSITRNRNSTDAQGASLHDLACELSDEVAYLRSFIELADEYAGDHCPDGKIIALIDAAVTRVRRVRELAEAVEIGACRGGAAR